MAMVGKVPAGRWKFYRSAALLAKQELGGKCVPKPELGNEETATRTAGTS
jgi:hypothetical protein